MELKGIRRAGLLLLCGAMVGCAVPQPKLVESSVGFARVDSELSADPEIEALIQTYKEPLEAQMNEVIGTAAADLNNHSRTGEFALGNFVADLMLAQSVKRYGAEIDLALINARGGLRIPISEGEITVGEVYELMPFDNEVWVVELTREQTQQVFDHCARTKRLAMAGARYQIQGARAVGIQIGKVPFDKGRTYLLAVPDFLATGGDRLDMLPQAKLIKKLNYAVRSMIIEHLRELNRKGIVVEPILDGRVVEL